MKKMNYSKKIMKTQDLMNSEEYKSYSTEQQTLIDLEFQALMHLNTIMSYRIKELKSHKGDK